MSKPQLQHITIGIPACNEEKDVEQVILAILGQNGSFKIAEIIVATDGCTDQTEKIVERLSKKHRIIRLISQRTRRGKMAAINEILALSKTPLIIIANADNLPDKNAIKELLIKMKKGVGLVGPQAICLLSKKPNLTERINQIIWSWHHIIALKNPKIVAFMLIDKTAVKSIADNCPVDEPLFEAKVRENGFEIAYAPKAKLYIKPPSLLSEHFSRRRSIHFGYFKMKQINVKYSPPTMDKAILVKLFFAHLNKKPLLIISATVIEMFSCLLGYFDYLRGKKYSAIWIQSRSSKGLEKC